MANICYVCELAHSDNEDLLVGDIQEWLNATAGQVSFIYLIDVISLIEKHCTIMLKNY